MASNSINVYAPASPSKYPYTIGVNFTEEITDELKTNNKSKISASATLYGKNIRYDGTGGTLAVYWFDNNKNQNGVLVASQTIKSPSMGVTYSASGTIEVEHDNDGKLQGYAKTIWTKTSSNSYVPPSTNVDTGWQTLTSIARATKINDFTATIGEPIKFTWSRASESFTHELKLVFNGKIITIGTNLENEAEWTPDESLYQKLESASDTGTLGLTTYNGDIQVGSTQMGTLTLNAKQSVAEPVFITKKAIDTNATTKALTGNENILVFYKSNTNFILEFNTREYATATKVIIENTEHEVPEGTLQSDKKTTKYSMNIDLGTTMRNNFNISITDTRGFTIKDLVINDNYVLYIPLDCNSSFKRVAPTTGDVGTLFNGNYYNGSFGSKSNTFKITYKYKKKNDTTYSSPITLTKGTHYTISGNKYYSGKTTTASTITLPTNFDYRSVYEGVMYVEDALTSIPINFLVVKGVPIFWWTGEKVVVNGDLYVADNDGNNPINVKDLAINPYPIGSFYHSEEETNPSEYFGGEWELIKTYRGGELLAYANVNATGGSAIGNAVTKPFSDASIGTHNANITSYVDDVLTYSAGAPLVKTKNIVGFVEADVYLAGLGGNNLYGMWWQGNANTLPQGVSLLSGGLYLSTGPIGYSYGGASNKYCYKVDGDGEFFVNPSFYPYGGQFTPGAGGTYSYLSVKVFAKAGTTYEWKRVA